MPSVAARGLTVGQRRLSLAAGENIASKFKPGTQGVWEWKLDKPLPIGGVLTVSVADKQGNRTRIERTFTVGR
jgi:hypothetical protein